MRSKFDEQLLELNHQMIEMGNNIISSIQKAIEALVAKDVDHATNIAEWVIYSLKQKENEDEV